MNRRWHLHSAIALVTLSASALVRADEAERPSAAPAIADLIADLDSDTYAVRKKATRALIEAGAPAVMPLAEAAKTGTLEVSTRAFRILQELYTGANDDKAVSAADSALESLAEGKQPTLAARAEEVLEKFDELREKRALVHIERLGGVVNYADTNDLFRSPNQIINPNRLNRPPASNASKKQLAYVLIGSKWKGGDAGLKYVRRLSRLGTLYISGAGEASPVSREAEQSLQASLPNLMIQHRGAAYLGISGQPHPRGCQVRLVKEKTAAAKAGLLEQDIITGMDDKDVGDFETLIEQIKNYSPGDKVKVHVLRGNNKLTLEVVMGEWR